MGYWPSVRSRWLDIGQVLFACLWTETKSRSINSQKKNEIFLYGNQTSYFNKLFIVIVLLKLCWLINCQKMRAQTSISSSSWVRFREKYAQIVCQICKTKYFDSTTNISCFIKLYYMASSARDYPLHPASKISPKASQKKNLANIQPSWPHTWSITHTNSWKLIFECSILATHIAIIRISIILFILD